MTIRSQNTLTPQERRDRDAILEAVASFATTLASEPTEKRIAWTREAIEREATDVLHSLALPLEHLAWTMVALGSRLWRDDVASVPYTRRILLLPHCMRDATLCPATMNAQGLQCEECGQCRIGGYKRRAESLGYHVLIAEGTPIVSRWIVSGKADAILGVGCLKSLERAVDKLAFAGIPAMAVPLLSATCSQTSADDDRVLDLIETPFIPRPEQDTIARPLTPRDRFLPLLRHAAHLFDSETRNSLLPQRRRDDAILGTTERIAHDFLVRGGKFYRPFLTLAVYDALQRREHDAEPLWTDDVHRVAMAMEVFHKASLVHDDIEDDDPFRYGVATVHHEHGVATAINVGDYLIGWGYRLIAETSLAPATRGRLLTILATAHTRLAEGQGADIAHRGALLAPQETLKVYALKTAPAFEAAVLSGVALVEDEALWETLREPLARFCRHLGVAFQIRNDLDDWLDSDEANKKSRGRDAAAGRPTILRALAAAHAVAEPVESNTAMWDHYQQTGAWEQTQELLAKYRTQSDEIARAIPHRALRELLEHILATLI